MIGACLLLGCSPSSTRPVDQRSDLDQQVSSELIAFVSDREGSDALFVMSADGSGVRRLTGELPEATGAARSLTDSPGFDGQPAWQPTRDELN
jgi:hypothetical protein